MRIGILCPYSLSVPGGVQGQVLGIARELALSGDDVTVLAPIDAVKERGDNKSLPELAPPGCELVDLGGSVRLRTNGSVAPVALGPTASLRALRALRAKELDILHIHEPLAPGANYACLAFWRGTKIGTFHRSGDSAFYRLLAPVARALANRLEVRCAVSVEARAHTAARTLGGSYELVGNGVEFDRFAGAEPWPADGPTVMFIGRHETRKGLGVLLEAFASLGRVTVEDGVEDGVEDTVLWVAGSGPETERLRRLYPESRSVRWLGRIPDDEAARRLRGCQVACFPALGGESFGVVLLEAMAAGVAVLASAIPGYRAAGEGYASFVEPADPGALATALAAALSDAVSGSGRSAPAALAAAASHAESSSMPSIAARYKRLYSEAVQR